ncbi:MAG: FkbM family methyltransferase [Pirellulales bacterium]|nr:FkbM family methyltransferase [Pirellulales bacterium]
MKIGRWITEPIAAAMPEWLYCAMINFRCMFRGREFRLRAVADGGPYIGKRTGEEIQLARRNRFKRYDKGIARWIGHLAGTYCLNEVPLAPGDKIIDCGANVGEIGIWAKQFQAEYHPFEPEEKEADCCDLNNFSGERRTVRKALWHEETELRFFSKPDTADSTAIEAGGYKTIKIIQATTLAHYIRSLGSPRFRLLKVEAEGAEPEVLQGAEGVLHLIDYIAVDCGRERGKERKSTFCEVNEILRRHNFEVINADMKRLAFLYRRRDLLDLKAA